MIKSYDDKFRNYKIDQKKDIKETSESDKFTTDGRIVYNIEETVDGKQKCVCRQLPEK